MKKSFRLLALMLAIATLAGCIERKPIKVQDRENPVTAKLTEMVTQEDRMLANQGPSTSAFRNLNLSHREEVYHLLAQAVISDPEDLHRAALILSRADSDHAAEACLIAHFLAKTAVVEGNELSRRLVARSMDRYLVLSGGTQLYGTQYYNDSAGVLRLYPVDPTITDSIRAEFDLLPLDSLRSRISRGEPL